MLRLRHPLSATDDTPDNGMAEAALDFTPALGWYTLRVVYSGDDAWLPSGLDTVTFMVYDPVWQTASISVSRTTADAKDDVQVCIHHAHAGSTVTFLVRAWNITTSAEADDAGLACVTIHVPANASYGVFRVGATFASEASQVLHLETTLVIIPPTDAAVQLPGNIGGTTAPSQPAVLLLVTAGGLVAAAYALRRWGPTRR